MKRPPIRLEPVDYMTLMLGALLNDGVGHSAFTHVIGAVGGRITIPVCAHGMVGTEGYHALVSPDESAFRTRLANAGLTPAVSDAAVRRYLESLNPASRGERMPWAKYRDALRIEMVEP